VGRSFGLLRINFGLKQKSRGRLTCATAFIIYFKQLLVTQRGRRVRARESKSNNKKNNRQTEPACEYSLNSLNVVIKQI
jgi:hypothetical protein